MLAIEERKEEFIDGAGGRPGWRVETEGRGMDCFWIDFGGRWEGQDLREVCLLGVG